MRSLRIGLWIVRVMAVAGLILAIAAWHQALSRDLGQWEASDLAIRKWFQSLMQPDNPYVSCCGESDAYWADSFEVDGDRYVAIITDDRDIPGRPHIPPGTKLVVPNSKLKFDAGNPTGHGVIFVRANDQFVLCYITPGGI